MKKDLSPLVRRAAAVALCAVAVALAPGWMTGAGSWADLVGSAHESVRDGAGDTAAGWPQSSDADERGGAVTGDVTGDGGSAAGSATGEDGSGSAGGAAGGGAPADDAAVAVPAWSAEAYPDYYAVLGRSEHRGGVYAGTVEYGGLDGLGRASGVAAGVTFEMMEEGSARERGDISDVKPSGWPSKNPIVSIALKSGKAYRGYLWNRSHLLAKSLGGSDGEDNLITGTRMQNVGANDGLGGMAYCEGVARDWLHDNPSGWLLYSAVPFYDGTDAVARYVIVDMLSSDGSIDERAAVYNAATGFAIDYSDGSWVEER